MRREKQPAEAETDDGEELAQLPPETLRRRVQATPAILLAQEAAAQVRNDANALLKEAFAARRKLPTKIDLKKTLKGTANAVALGRAKQVQYAVDDACAMHASYRSNFFDWVKDHASRQGKPRPPRFYRQGQRARVRFDYQDFTVLRNRLYLPATLGLPAIPLLDRQGEPLMEPGDRLVEVRLEPCRSRQYVDVNFVIRRKPKPEDTTTLAGTLFIDLGVARLVTCLDDKHLNAFFVSGGVAKAILQRGAKWYARLRSESKLGIRHGKRRAGQLAARSARQMDDLMKKVSRLVVQYAYQRKLASVVVGRNVEWKQNAEMGKKQNQLFTFIPHAKLIAALRTKCQRAGIVFIETEESYTSKTDHLAFEAMGPKPSGYRWLGSRSPRGCFRSSVGISLQADVNGRIGLGVKVGGKAGRIHSRSQGWVSKTTARCGLAASRRCI